MALGFAASRFLKASSYPSLRVALDGLHPADHHRGLTTGAPTSRTGLGADDVVPVPAATTGVPPTSGTGIPPRDGVIVTDPSAAAGDIPIRREDYTR